MKAIAIALLTLVSASAFSATSAKIIATDANANIDTIALDASGNPRVNGNPKSYPTIKDFREDSDYAPFCYEGSFKDAKKLLTGLVDAANGDGDSWAEVDSIKANATGVITVIAKITDEGGEGEETYIFEACKK